MQAALEQARDAIRRFQYFLITTHVNPDGDGVGSELGLARFLRALNKNVSIVNSTALPHNYRFLDRTGQVRIFDPHNTDELDRAEIIFICDISRWERLGPMNDYIRNHSAIKICIDHHPVCGDFADINLICVDACASGEILLDLITSMSGELTSEIAEPIYASILTDTGGFRFPNTTAKTHAAAARLLATGINSSEIYEQIYERCSPARIKLLSLALGKLEYMHDGRLAWTTITQNMMRQTGVQPDEIDGFADIARCIRRVEVSLLFIELFDGNIKISLRSKGDVDVNCFASRFGGGGHRHAAGILVSGPLSAVIDRILESTSLLFPVIERLLS